MRPVANIITIAATLLSGFSLAAAQDVPVMHGRVSFGVDSGLIKGAEDADWSYASVNTLVLPGDMLWVDDEGTLEAEFNGGTFLRLVDGSKAEVVSTPPQARFKGWEGSFYVHRVRRSTGEVVFETPVGFLTIEKDSQVRVDILNEGATTVTVRWGSAMFQPDGGNAVRVRQGKRIFIDPGYLPSNPENFDRNYEDDFDAWNRERSRSIALGAQNTSFDGGGIEAAPIGAVDLSNYGEWIYVNNRRSWRPAVVDYVPYRRGSWSYVPSQGYVWVGYYPFSYVTSHHGYWDYHHTHGWLWSYHRPYSPAYVAAVRYGDLHVWAPLGIHGDAVYYGNNFHLIGGLHFGFGIATFAYADHLFHGHHHVHSFHHHHVKHHYNHHVYHWDIYNHHSPYYHHRPKYKYRHPARDYSPKRVMRGPDRYGDGYESARTRVSRLETRSPRTSFRVNPARTARTTRTMATARNVNQRAATTRSVRIKQTDTEALTRATRERTTRTLSNRDVSTRTGTINRIRTAPKSTSSKRVTESSKERATRGVPNSPQVNNGDRSNRTRTPSLSDEKSSTTPRVTSPRTTTRQGTPSPRVSETPRKTSPRVSTTPRVSTRQTTPTPRVTQPQRTPSREITTSPRTSTAPRVSTRQSTPRPQVTSPRTTAPRVSTPRVTPTPRATVTPPQRSNRSATVSPKPTQRQSAPQSYSAPRQQAPQSYSAPRQSAPRSYSPPSVSSGGSSSRSSAPSTSSRGGGSSRGANSRGGRN